MASTSSTNDLAELRDLYADDLAARAIFDAFANRTNNQRITPVDKLHDRVSSANVQRYEVIRVLRKLEELGHGTFIEGRKGHPSRFQWSSSVIDVGKAAQGEKAPIALVSMDAGASSSVEDLRTYTFPLRTGMDARFELPADLTDREVERLHLFLKALAISS